MKDLLSAPVTGYKLIVHLLVCLSFTGAALFVALSVNRTSERKLCDITRAQLAAYAEAPPTTDTGKALMGQYSVLKLKLGC